VSHVNRHPAASWSLPPGVTSQVAEVATSPATSTDGYFFFENVFLAGLCPVREFSQIMTLEIPKTPPPPPPLRCRVPNLIGLGLARAKIRIRRAHCSVRLVRRVRAPDARLVGRVVSQNPRPGVIRVRGFGIRIGVGRL
jgi:hypothetical protein